MGQKQKTEKKKERPKVGNKNGHLRIATHSGGTRKPPGPKLPHPKFAKALELCFLPVFILNSNFFDGWVFCFEDTM